MDHRNGGGRDDGGRGRGPGDGGRGGERRGGGELDTRSLQLEMSRVLYGEATSA